MIQSNRRSPLIRLLHWGRPHRQPANGSLALRVAIGLLALTALALMTLGPLPASAQADEPPEPPVVPDRPTATAIHEGTVDLEWNDVPGAASYDVQAFRSDWFDLPGNGVGIAFYGPGAIIRDLIPESRYYFRVRANNALGSSEWSEHRLVDPTGGDFGNWDGVPEPTNRRATGAPTISGMAQVDETLTADLSDVVDENGLDRVKFHYQWMSSDGTTDTDIEGATDDSYTPVAGNVGNTVKVQVYFTDRGGYKESIISSATAEVVAPLNVSATGAPSIMGRLWGNKTLAASVSDIVDANGLDGVHYSYQWISNDGTTDTDIEDATEATYTLRPDDEDKTIKVRVTFNDRHGYAESLTSAATEKVGQPDYHGDTIETATDLPLDTLVDGVFNDSDDMDFFKIELLEPTFFKALAYGPDDVWSILAKYTYLTSDGSEIRYTGFGHRFEAGTYYVKVQRYDAYRNHGPERYRFQVKVIPDQGNAIETALPVALSDPAMFGTLRDTSAVYGDFHSANDVDFFRLDLTSATEVKVDINIGHVITAYSISSSQAGAGIQPLNLDLVDSEGIQVGSPLKGYPPSGGRIYQLDAGTHYFRLSPFADEIKHALKGYSFNVGATDGGEADKGICDRSERVQWAIIHKLRDVSDCGTVTEAHLSSITSGLYLQDAAINQLKAEDLDGLTGLRALYLGRNNLSALPGGVFDDLSDLEVLSLAHNDLTSLPDGVFDNLSRLRGLYLGNNDLGTLPDGVFDNLTSLEVLSLVSNDLTSLPDGVFDNLSSLLELYLGNNGLTSLPDGVLSSLSSLEVLSFSGSGDAPSPFPQKTVTGLPGISGVAQVGMTLRATTRNIRDQYGFNPNGAPEDHVVITIGCCSPYDANGVDFGYQWVRGDETAETEIPGATNSTYILMAADEGKTIKVKVTFTNAGHNVETLTSAATLPVIAESEDTVEGICYRNGKVRQAILAKLPEVGHCESVTDAHLSSITGRLYLSTKWISELSADDFRGLSNLEELHFDLFPNLTTLPLTTLPAGVFDDLPSLRVLRLNAFGLTSLPAGVFDNLSNLERLDLSYNGKLTSLPYGAFDELDNLQVLNLGITGLTSLPAGVFDNLANLQQLDLHKTNLTSLPAGVFDSLANLERLDLNNSSLTSLPDGVFDELSDLEYLNLSTNKLASLPNGAFADLSHLAELHLHRNDLISLPDDGFDGLRGLKTLYLSYNDLTSLPDGIFDDLSSLEELSLRDNKLPSLPAGVFDNLSNLEDLYLGYNDFASLPDGIFDNLSSLEQLALYDNDLESLSDGVFDDLFNLEELYLGYNDLTSLPNGVFDAVSNLKRLSLYSNELNSLPDGVFTGLSSLEFLEFDGNPGAPFLLEAELEQQGGDAVVVKIAEAAPFDLEVALTAQGGVLTTMAATAATVEVIVAAGATTSEAVTVVPDEGQTEVTVIAQSSAFPSGIYGHRVSGIFGGIRLGVGASYVITPDTSQQQRTATGLPTISGTAQVGETLTADTSSIADDDGLENAEFSYQWLRNDGIADTEIEGATEATYTLVADDEGKTIKVKVTFTDDEDNPETRTSDPTGVVAAGPNNAPEGLPAIIGIVQVGEELTADTSGISDADGLNNSSFSYQWVAIQRNSNGDIQGSPNEGSIYAAAMTVGEFTSCTLCVGSDTGTWLGYHFPGPSSTYGALSQDFFLLRYDVDYGVAAILLANSERVQLVLLPHPQDIFLDLLQGFALRLDDFELSFSEAHVSDFGLVKFYVWEDPSLSWSEGQQVNVSILDPSDSATPQTNGTSTPDVQAAGAPSIGGKAQVSRALTASIENIGDASDLGDAPWSEAEITGATSSSYTLVADDAGKTIKVKVSFTDNAGNTETRTSGPTNPVTAKEPDAPGHLNVSPNDENALDLYWEAPASDGGSPITGYKVQWKAAADSWDTPADVSQETVTGTTYTITGLTGGLEYAVRVVATNQVGDGPASAEKTAVPRETGAPEVVRPRVDGATLRVLYDEALDEGSAPPADAFDVRVVCRCDDTKWQDEKARRVVDAVSVNGDTVVLTLASAVTAEDSVVVSYTPPSDEASPRVQDAAGNPAAAIRPTQVFNDTEEANNPATGAPAISGTAQVDETLTADTSGIADADGLDNATFSYQWTRSDGSGDSNIQDATGSSYTLTGDDEGKTIKVTVFFTDAEGNPETLTSAATGVVTDEPNTKAAGAPTIDGLARVGETLTADTSGIDDDDELTNVAFSYQWLADDADIAGATGSTYTLVAADGGRAIKVVVSFTDDRGNEETLASEPTGAVPPDPGPLTTFTLVDASTDPDTPLGALVDEGTLILGNPTGGEYGIRVDTDSNHDDHDDIQKVVLALSGAKDVSRPEKHSPYSLYGDSGEDNLNGGNLPAGSYTLTATAHRANGDVLGTLTVSFTVEAQEQTAVPNTEATGAPTIDGAARVGETLTADTSGIDDDDGLTNVAFSYQWVRSDGSGDSNIQDATGSSYTLTGDDEGRTIKVTVSFTDGEGNSESLTSDPTSEVAPASGPLTAFTVVDTSTDPDKVLGTLEDGRTLTLAAPAGDSYGIRVDTESNDDIQKVELALSRAKTESKTEWEPPYSLYGDSGAENLTGEDLPAGSYDLTATAYKNNGDVLGTLKVSFSVAYADPAEEQPPAQNTLATGAPTIDGIARVGQTLTADTSGIHDADEMTNVVFSYQWLRSDGGSDTNITGATGSTYTLVSDDEGKTLKVTVSFTDAEGNPETLTSDSTGKVEAKPNTKATGLPTISGIVRVGETLTADTSGIADEDGLTNATYSYQWISFDDNSETEIANASGSTYKLGFTDLTKKVKVSVSVTDDSDNQESLTSEPVGPVEFEFSYQQSETPVENSTVEVASSPEFWSATMTVAAVDDTHLGFSSHGDGAGSLDGHDSFIYTPDFDFTVELVALDDDTLSFGMNHYLQQYHYPQWTLVVDGEEFSFEGVENGEILGTGSDAVSVYQWPKGDLSWSDGDTVSISLKDTTPPVLAYGYVPRLYGTVILLWSDWAGMDQFNLPPASSITVHADGNEVAVGGVHGVGGALFALDGVSPAIKQGQTVTLTYTDPSPSDDTKAFQDGLGNDAPDFTATLVNESEVLTDVSQSLAVGGPTISGTAQVGQTLTADTTGIQDANGLSRVKYSYQWIRNDGTSDEDIEGETGSTYLVSDMDVGKTIKVRVSFRDDVDYGESLTSAATAVVVATVPTEPLNLTVTTGTHVQELDASWQAPSSNGGSVITGYKVRWKETTGSWDTAADVSEALVTSTSHTITRLIGGVEHAVRVIATNDAGDGPPSEEMMGTPAGGTSQQQDADPENSEPTGLPSISGTVRVGETLTAGTAGIADADGLTNATFSYQWIRNDGTADTEISGATADTYTLVTGDAGKTIEVKVSFTDDAGSPETLSSAATAVVAPKPNAQATGAPNISGTAQVGQTLTANTSGIADDDGLTNPDFTYQWARSDGGTDSNIQDAIGSTYTLTEDDAGRTIKLTVSFTDDAGNSETLPSVATGEVAPKPNTQATGQPTISGTAQVGQTLTADVTSIADEDGLSDAVFSYQWVRSDGDSDTNLQDATGSSYTLVAEDEGRTVKVKVSFTDAQSNPETLTSDPTGAVEPKPNTKATGLPTISGTEQVGETLTADTSGIDDEDELTQAVFSYQWVRSDGDGDTNIQDANGSSYTLVSEDEGQTIRVKVSFTDDQGNAESLTSDPTGEVEAAETVPGRPQDLDGEASAQGIKLTWKAPSGSAVTQYAVYRGILQNGSMNGQPMTKYATIDATGEAMAYTDADVKAGVEYRYRVAAVNSSGEGRKSGWVDIGAGS